MKIFFYDGQCNFCKDLAGFLEKITLNSEIQYKSFRDYSESDLRKIHPSLSHDVCQGNVQFIFEGKRYPGFFGIRKLFPYLKKYRYLTPLLYLPLIPILGILILKVLKHFRNRLGYDG